MGRAAADIAAQVVAAVESNERRVPVALQAALAGRYTILRELARGGMATVYLARDERHDRDLAVKVVRAGVALDSAPSPGALRFQREIDIAARLSHPHILPLHDSGASGGLLYYIMPYVEGETLRERLARGPLSIEDTIRVLRDVTSALAYAHRQGIVHRDIKPANILLNQVGDALVSDFGVAKALAAASEGGERTAEQATAPFVLGTPTYIAPEQAAGDPTTDHRADLYALGVVAYEMLSGAPPFAARSAHEAIAAHLSEQPQPIEQKRPDTPDALAQLISRLLAKRPADRPQHTIEVLDSLHATQAPAHTVTTKKKWQLSRSRAVLATGLLLTITAFGLIPVLRGRQVDRVDSIAVLAFANTSGRAEDEPLSDGLTDELIAALGKVAGLKVTGRTSTFALKGRELSLRTIADTLDVTAVLEGSVRRDADRLKVTTTLVDARANRVLWSNTYERALSDIFAVQEEIARAVVSALSLQLTGSQSAARLVERGTENLEAYQLYLKGRYQFNTRQRAGLLSALKHFEDAIALDPSYARAHAGLADVYNSLGILGYARPHDVFPKARAAAERALVLDSLLVEAYAARAHQLFVYEWDWRSAERVFKRAIALNPAYAEARLYYGVYLHVTGRHDEALTQLRVASELDPLMATELMIGRVYVNIHQPDRAIEHLREMLDLNRNFDLAYQQLAHAYLQKGMFDQAIQSMRRAAESSGPRDSAQLAYVYAAAGDTSEGRRVLRALLDTAPQRYLPPFHIAMAYAGLGDVDESFRWLELARDQRASFMDGIAVHAGFESIRSDPRFERLLQRMGLQ
jgi:serine/threonine-protein kinase